MASATVESGIIPDISFSNGGAKAHPPSDSDLDLDAVVIGASWAGIWTLHLLKSQGLKCLLIDACADVGGTWFYTRYPGCRVDTEVPLYEFSDPVLWENWNWSQRFPSQREVLRYLGWVCDRLNLRESMVLGTRVESATWNDDTHRWNISTNAGSSCTSKYFVLCTGYTTIRYIPEFKGAKTFQNSFHSANWPDNVHLQNKRVGVIGTAASGLQIIETIGPLVKKLAVFQRTPNLATPMRQVDFDADSLQRVKKSYPERFQKRVSHTGFFSSESRCAFEDDAATRKSFYKTLWRRGGLWFWHGNYKDLLTSREANDEAYAFWRKQVHKRVHNAAVAEKLAPAKPPHAFGAKRPSLETTYFETFNLPHVDLIDLKDDPITEITPQGVQTESGFHDLDVLVYATGFDFLTGSALAINITGANGIKLGEKWDTRATGAGVWTALGLMTAGFPNMFFPLGPQAPSALGLTPQLAEIQGGWISNCIGHMRSNGLSKIDALADAELAWKAEVERAAKSNLIGEADSWYMGNNIPGRKKEAICYFGGVDKYAEIIEEEAEKGYARFRLS